DLVDVAVREDVLPRHQHLVEYDDRVVLVQAAGKRIIERAAHHRRGHLIGGAAEELHPLGTGRHDADEGEVLGLDRQRAVVGDEVVVRESRSGGDHFGSADDQPGVGFLLDVHVDVAHFGQFFVTVYRRIDDRVVYEGHFFL